MNIFKDYFLNKLSSIKLLKTSLRKFGITNIDEQKQKVRIVFINNKKPNDYINNEPIAEYAKNTVKTSKYTLLNFIPKNIYEQFRRFANLFFLITVIISIITPNPPINPYVNLLPLSFLLGATAIKQGYEDYLRYKLDKKENNRFFIVFRHGTFKRIRCKDIKCGDLVRVKANEQFPCDMILLYSSSDDKACHVTTVNLDGETNLKAKKVPNVLNKNNLNDLNDLSGIIVCDKPNCDLNGFKGKFILNGVSHPLTIDNFLHKGSCLKVSEFIIGCVIYAGKDTKMMLNSKYKSNKTSSVERVLNIIILLSVASVVLFTFLSFGLTFLYDDIYINHWYLWDIEPEYFKDLRYLAKIVALVFYMSIFNFLVPMSLYVTLELQRFFGVKFFQCDLEMYDEENDRPAKANNSDLNEDLGQIEYLFSDKTGTLTVNEMEFKECFIGDSIYHENNRQLVKVDTNELANLNDANLIKYFEVLTLCHSIQVDASSKEPYQASNPDELSFIKFCELIGIIYKGEFKCQLTHKTYRSINFNGNIKNYEVMRILDFDFYRKRMSIIVRCSTSNQIILLCKGAESLVIDRCSNGNFNACTRQANRFARNGWRTLAVAYKYLSIDEYNEYECLLNDALNDLDCREEKLTLIYNLIEKDFTLLGVTSVEDKLQEDCAETMNSLKQAGIRIWVLTGDKKETAISVSKLSKHVTREMDIIDLTDASSDSLLSLMYENYKKIETSTNNKFALIIDGRSLALYLDNQKVGLSKELINLCLKCEAVICCRLSPLQKAQIVKLVKESKDTPITAAIGDGANDVSMIQEAHIGIGIFGKEGKSAAISSDFAFSKFKFLKRAILVHGFLYYTRLAIFSQYFFYKNLVFVICQFYYAFYAAFSTQSLYNSIILTLYNSVLTFLPVLVFGLFEQKYNIDKIKSNPNYYKLNYKNELLSNFQLIKWTLLGLWHSLVAFYFTYGLWLSTSLNLNGTINDYTQFGCMITILVNTIVHIKLLLEWNYFTLLAALGFLISFLAFLVCCILPNSFIMPPLFQPLTEDQSLYFAFFDLLSQPSVWFCIVVSVIAALLPDIIVKTIENITERKKLNYFCRGHK